MDEPKTVRVESSGDEQTVHLPAELHLPGTSARARRVGKTVVLEPVESEETRQADLDAVWAEIDRLRGDRVFMPEGREQPPMPPDDDLIPFDP